MNFSAPRPIQPNDNVEMFDSGRPILDIWLKTRAIRNEGLASRTYVVTVCVGVCAYYSLAAGSVERAIAPGMLRRNMPELIPVMLLGRLAVDRQWQGKGIGRALVGDAMLRTMKAADIAGMRAMLVHALDGDAAAFYQRCGFFVSPCDPLVLFFPLAALASTEKPEP